jgi:predicted unusual protein kinase regulating ubiquinone biosynthesis (AarF/ABC1/UbiB family)
VLAGINLSSAFPPTFRLLSEGNRCQLPIPFLSSVFGIIIFRFSHLINRLTLTSLCTLFLGSLTVLEGIALSSDPNYKVLSSSYPWIARKVLTDKSPKLRSTLQELVYKVSNIPLFSLVLRKDLK